MLKLGRVTKFKMLYLVLVFVFNFDRFTILGDPGAISGDGEKSKTGEKKFGRRKVKNVCSRATEHGCSEISDPKNKTFFLCVNMADGTSSCRGEGEKTQSAVIDSSAQIVKIILRHSYHIYIFFVFAL